MLFGAENFLNSSSWKKKMADKKLAYLGNLASVDGKGRLILERLLEDKWPVSCVLSAQHGFFSTAQANMITSSDSKYQDLKVFSLYSEKTRRLTSEMKSQFDVLLFDLQDVGSRIYTYLTTLLYLLEDCEKDKTVILLDRPNPIGRYMEGSVLKEGFESFVGVAPTPMSHGLTLGELALWYKDLKKLKTNLQVVEMKSYNSKKPWDSPWVLPSPNMTSLHCAKCYPGTVLLEGCLISEGRGTTKPLETLGHPSLDTKKVLKFMQEKGGEILKSCFLKEIQFDPVFDKFSGKTCKGFQIYTDKSWVKGNDFKAYRLICLFLKAFHHTHPQIPWKSDPPYEYEYEKDPIDIISGGEDLKKWVESEEDFSHFEDFLYQDEKLWQKERQEYFIY